MNRITTDDVNWWPPRPLVLGHRIYHWNCWNVTLADMVYVPGMVQLILWDARNRRELVLKDTMWQGQRPWAEPGDPLDVFGIGERTVPGYRYSFVGLANHARGMYAHVNCWRSTINWLEADTYFGTKGKREAQLMLMTYYAGVGEVLFRTWGGTGALLVQKADEFVRFMLKSWRFEYI